MVREDWLFVLRMNEFCVGGGRKGRDLFLVFWFFGGGFCFGVFCFGFVIFCDYFVFVLGEEGGVGF